MDIYLLVCLFKMFSITSSAMAVSIVRAFESKSAKEPAHTFGVPQEWAIAEIEPG